jgi:predicted enzyme related to lactoylglutathione lyase
VTDHFSFTKLVVADLEASARFYTTVFGVREQTRVHAEIAGRPIDEILYEATGPGEEVILGIVTSDLDGVVDRVGGAGGTVVQAPTAMPEHGVTVAFVTDLEGHLIEVVELLPAGPATNQ